MMQKRLYIGQFNKAGQLVDVTTAKTVPYKNNRLIASFAQRISKEEYDAARLAMQSAQAAQN